MKKLVIIVVLSFMVSVFFYAKPAQAIIVDGFVSPGSEWDTWFISGIDPNESGIDDNYDIHRLFAWWDDTNVYIRTDVFGAPTLVRQDSGNFNPAFYQWSIDTDGDLTAELVLLYNQDDAGGVKLYDVSGGSPVLLGSGIGAYDDIVEVSFATSLVPEGLAPASDFDVAMFLRLDNAGEDDDDRLPDIGWSHTTPEPSSMLLLGVGLLGVVGRRVFRKKF